MNNLRIFENAEFGKIRTIAEDLNLIWFCVNDICGILDYGNPREAISKHVDKKDVTKRDTLTAKGLQSMLYINESGLYSLIFGSKMPKAREFTHWVTSEVIPSIRKHGAYMTPDTLEKALSDPDFIIQLATNLKMERAKRLEAEALNAKQQKQIEAAKPAQVFCEAVSASEDTILVREMAKLLKQNGVQIGQDGLFDWLKENGYLCKNQNNEPTQYAMDLGLFKRIERVITLPNGTPKATFTTKITGKGQRFFINKWLNIKKKKN